MSSPLQTNITNLQNLLDKVNALPEAGSGMDLPELTNEGVADDLVSGKELIDSDGNIVTGTNPYEKVATDTEIATQTDLLAQAVAALEGKAAGGGSGSGSGSVETCAVTVTSADESVTVPNHTVIKYNNGIIEAVTCSDKDNEITYVLCNSILKFDMIVDMEVYSEDNTSYAYNQSSHVFIGTSDTTITITGNEQSFNPWA